MSELENIANEVSDLNDTMEQIRMHLKNIRYAVESNNSELPQPSPNDNVDEASKDKDYGRDKASEAAQHMVEAGLSLSKLEVRKDDGEIVIDRKRDHDQSDEFMEWTQAHFGEDKPGWINWGSYTKDDGSEGWYPQEFRLPTENFEQVFG